MYTQDPQSLASPEKKQAQFLKACMRHGAEKGQLVFPHCAITPSLTIHVDQEEGVGASPALKLSAAHPGWLTHTVSPAHRKLEYDETSPHVIMLSQHGSRLALLMKRVDLRKVFYLHELPSLTFDLM